MNMWRLRATMLTTLLIIIGVSTLFFTVILGYLGALNMGSLVILVILYNLAQWLFAPNLLKMLYRIEEANPLDYKELYTSLDQLSKRSNIKTPKLGISSMPIPNAFAFGSPLSGNYVVVTSALLGSLDSGEIDAVLGHEVGHLKHRDVQVMMFASFLPSLIYILGRSMLYSSYYGNRNSRSGASSFIGILSMVVYFMLSLFSLKLSRMREYYADAHSVSIVANGSSKLSEGLAKIVSWRGEQQQQHQTGQLGAFNALFISAIDGYGASTNFENDSSLVDEYLYRELTNAEKIMELFSTHPNITKRLGALKRLESY